MHERLMQCYEWMCTTRVPYFALGRITMVADPDVSMKILKPVVANHVVAIAHHLKHQHIFSVGEDKSSFFARGSVIRVIQAIAVLVDNLVRDARPRQRCGSQPSAVEEALDGFRPHTHKILNDFWRPRV